MVDRLNHLLIRAKRSGLYFAVLFMDIDRFKEVNDAHGHEAGDLLLAAIGRRLTKCMRDSDTVARIGGDEFVVVMETVHSIPEADAVAHRVQRALAAPFILQGQKLKVAASIGVSFYPTNGDDADTLLRSADYAMYLAKRRGGNCHLTCLPGISHSGEIPERPAPAHTAVKGETVSVGPT
jgi:diguanylate cyclase (GGDEF)-like protein